MISEWFIWCDTKTEHKARKLLDRVAACLQRTPTITGVEYDVDTPGYTVNFRIELKSDRWNDAVVELIALGQEVADTWRIYSPGSPRIHEYACIFAGETRISGVVGIEGSIDTRTWT